MLNKFDIDFLENHTQFYSKLTKEDKDIFNSKAIHVMYSKDDSLYFSDKNCNGFITVLSGSLRAFLTSEEGKEITLYRLEKGYSCILSASCIFKNIQFSINIDALENTEAIVLPSEYLQRFSQNNMSLNQYILDLTQSRFSEVMWIMQDIVFTSFDKRLIKYLESFNEKVIKVTHESIANDLGTAREVVSRMLKYFEKEGMVKLSRGSITIIDLNKNK
ncbi:MAG: Crp/Fnr family transcriptional regulator [Clostridium sp.]|uniref:DNA-binding transcriptional dual regulator Crp n=1 Tax=Clostridium paraputrificum TaxID=29363 RepID=A0A6N3E2S8_9CLOT|nr:Crp/Fnr family transcriptional regulator [Clostridium sp.]MBS5927443.1 Crp/Fnr family transcriptional regulator [Clostridium sp.]MBS5985998.1 Crp/Fnr family transcriptional regulator [Clostridium sp.]